MILTFRDDQVLRVYDSPAEVSADVEALDAEATLRAVFNETGRRYVIKWSRPNRVGNFTAENGEYTLVADGPVDIRGLLDALRETRFIEPQARENEVRELQRRLTSRFSGPVSLATERPSH